MTTDHLSGLWRAEQAPELTLRGWEDMLGQARRSRLQARLALHFEERGWLAQVPPGPATYLSIGKLAAERQRREVEWELDRIDAALSGVDTPVVVLKGAAYLLAGLPPGQGRLFSDIDIMVARDRLPQAEAAMLAAGWAPEPHDDYDDLYYRRWSHELPPLKHVQRGTFLDMHHTISPPTSRYVVSGETLLKRAVPARPGHRLLVLCPEDMVLHSVVHLIQEGEFDAGLRDLLDIQDLIRHFEAKPGFWSRLLDRAKELGLETPLSLALTQLRRRLAWQPPPSKTARLADLDRRIIVRPLMAHLLSLALAPHHPSCDSRASEIARLALYIRSHYLRMPLLMVLPHLARKAWKRLRAKPKSQG